MSYSDIQMHLLKIGIIFDIRSTQKFMNVYFKDNFIKRRYKTIYYDREFGPELLSALPFAYWHYKNGTLKKTISLNDTKAFYFFSQHHEEIDKPRIFKDPIKLIPNHANHVFKYSTKKWLQVPLKDYYKNQQFRYKKPFL